MLVLLAFLNALSTGIQSLPGASPPGANFCVVTQHGHRGAQMEGLEEPSKDHLSSRSHVMMRGGDASPGSTLSFTRGGEHVLQFLINQRGKQRPRDRQRLTQSHSAEQGVEPGEPIGRALQVPSPLPRGRVVPGTCDICSLYKGSAAKIAVDVRAARKVRWYSHAKALLLPTRLNAKGLIFLPQRGCESRYASWI